MNPIQKTSSQPIVSILIPIYNVEGYIEMSARSLLEQSYEACRYIFVDDCSTDGSVAELERVVAEYPHRAEQITIIKNQENQGVGAVRNILLDAADGDYLLFVDSDDWVEHIAVESLVTRAIVTRADIVRSWRVEEFSGGERRLDRVGWLSTNPQSSLRAVLEQIHLFPNYIHGLLISRELVERESLRFPRGVNMGEDYTMLSKLLYHARSVAQLNMPLYHYRCSREGSYMSNISAKDITSYISANQDVTEYFASRNDGERYAKNLLWGRLNILKWVFRRGCRVSDYYASVMQGSQPCGLLPKIYSFALLREWRLLIILIFSVSSLGVGSAIFFSKFRGNRSNIRKKMWG